MSLIVDSSVLIHVERHRLPIAGVRLRFDEAIAISVVTLSELLTGAYRANDPARQSLRIAYVSDITSSFRTLAIDETVARMHARVWADLARTGKLIGERDLWIAATAITHEAGVLAENVAEFERVPGLRVIRPSW